MIFPMGEFESYPTTNKGLTTPALFSQNLLKPYPLSNQSLRQNFSCFFVPFVVKKQASILHQKPNQELFILSKLMPFPP